LNFAAKSAAAAAIPPADFQPGCFVAAGGCGGG